MNKATLSEPALNAATDAVSSLLNGGEIVLLDQTGQAMAKAKLGSPAFQPAAGGIARATPIQPTMGIATGTAVAFVATDAAGNPVIQGSDLASGPVQVYLGGTVRLEGFEYGVE